MPTIPKLESLPDPKQNLHELLRNASELKGRRLKKFSVSTSALRVAEFIEDFSPLRAMHAFKSLEEDFNRVLSQHGW